MSVHANSGVALTPRMVAFMLEQLMKKGLLWGLGAEPKA